MIYFVYELIDPRTDEPRYVGMTSNPNDRMKQHLADSISNLDKWIWIQELAKEGLKPYMRIAEIVYDDLKVAIRKERNLIQEHIQAQKQLTNIYINNSEEICKQPKISKAISFPLVSPYPPYNAPSFREIVRENEANYITSRNTADMLNINENDLNKYTREEKIKAVEYNGHTYYHIREIDKLKEWLIKNCQETRQKRFGGMG